MRRYVMTYGAAFAAVLAMGFGACGDDDTTDPTTTTDTSTTSDADATSDPDATTDPDGTTGGDTTGDTTPGDPCDPNPCNAPPVTACSADNSAVVTFASTGTCTESGGNASCTYAPTETDCDANEFCAAGVCQGNPANFEAGPASYISSLSIGDNTCCDQNDDGTPDNKLGSIFQLLGLAGLDFDIDGSIADAIESGSLVLLFDFPNLTGGAADQTGLQVRGFIGTRIDDHATSTAGNGSFTVDDESFVGATNIPQIAMSGAIAGGQFDAGPATFRLSIPIPDVGNLSLGIANTELQSAVSVGANGEGLTHTSGILSGLIPFSEFIDAFNALGANCECFGLAEGELPFEVKVTGTGANRTQSLGCTEAFNNSTPECGEEDGSVCEGIGGNKGIVCGLAGTILTADIDTDQDGTKDHMSAYLDYTGVSATITGRTTEVE